MDAAWEIFFILLSKCSMGRLKGSFLFCLFFHRLKGSILYLIGKINGHQRVQLGIIILICI